MGFIVVGWDGLTTLWYEKEIIYPHYVNIIIKVFLFLLASKNNWEAR